MKKLIDRFVNWINKVLTHNRDTEHDFGIRALIHIPIGFFMGLLDDRNGMNELFRFYERNEDRHTGDQAWKDTFGAMVGYAVGKMTRVALIVWAIIAILSWIKGVIEICLSG